MKMEKNKLKVGERYYYEQVGSNAKITGTLIDKETFERDEKVAGGTWCDKISDIQRELRPIQKTKKEILSKWLYSWKNGDGLWGNQAGLIYETIKENSIDEALKILNNDYEKYKHMGIASYITEAIEDLKQL